MGFVVCKRGSRPRGRQGGCAMGEARVCYRKVNAERGLA